MITLFLIYYFNLDMKLISVVYNLLGKHFDKKKVEDKI